MEKILEMVKQDMIQSINQINMKNLQLTKELLLKQFLVMEAVCDVESYKTNNETELGLHPLVAKNTTNEIKSEEVSEIIPLPIVRESIELNTELQENPSYIFERRIRGGVLPDIGAYVPEKVVRYLDIQHGDYLYANEIEEEEYIPHKSPKKYEYQLAKKGNGQEPKERIQHNFCPVIKENGVLAVEKSAETDQYIRHNEARYTVVIGQEDIDQLQLTEGSLVDIAYPEGRPDLVKVIWSHSLTKPEDESTIEQLIMGNSSKPNKKETPPPLDQTLIGQTILVIGNEPKKALYKENIEKRGGTFLWSDAKEKLIRLESMVRKADKVIFLLAVSGHTGMEHIKQFCKDNEIPFETPWSKGISTVVKIAEAK